MTFISDINPNSPAFNDDAGDGDDQIRQLKSDVKDSFPNVNSAVTVTPTELNYLDGLTENVQDALDNSVNSFTIQGDTGSTVINDGDTVDIAGGTNVTTAESAGTVTVNVPDADLSTKGAVQLNNSLTSDSTSLALTASRGKVLQDNKLNNSGAKSVSGTTTFNADVTLDDADLYISRDTSSGARLLLDNTDGRGELRVDEGVLDLYTNSTAGTNEARHIRCQNSTGATIFYDGIGNQIMTVSLFGTTMATNYHIADSVNPTEDNHLARKAYVDAKTAKSGTNTKGSVKIGDCLINWGTVTGQTGTITLETAYTNSNYSVSITEETSDNTVDANISYRNRANGSFQYGTNGSRTFSYQTVGVA